MSRSWSWIRETLPEGIRRRKIVYCRESNPPSTITFHLRGTAHTKARVFTANLGGHLLEAPRCTTMVNLSPALVDTPTFDGIVLTPRVPGRSSIFVLQARIGYAQAFCLLRGICSPQYAGLFYLFHAATSRPALAGEEWARPCSSWDVWSRFVLCSKFVSDYNAPATRKRGKRESEYPGVLRPASSHGSGHSTTVLLVSRGTFSVSVSRLQSALCAILFFFLWATGVLLCGVCRQRWLCPCGAYQLKSNSICYGHRWWRGFRVDRSFK